MPIVKQQMLTNICKYPLYPKVFFLMKLFCIKVLGAPPEMSLRPPSGPHFGNYWLLLRVYVCVIYVVKNTFH